MVVQRGYRWWLRGEGGHTWGQNDVMTLFWPSSFLVAFGNHYPGPRSWTDGCGRTGSMLVDWVFSSSVRLFSEFWRGWVNRPVKWDCDVQDYSLALGGVIMYLEDTMSRLFFYSFLFSSFSLRGLKLYIEWWHTECRWLMWSQLAGEQIMVEASVDRPCRCDLSSLTQSVVARPRSYCPRTALGVHLEFRRLLV